MSDLRDPRVLFAAERTLLAWSRTSLTLMAFGFVIERFGLFVHMLSPQAGASLQRGTSFWLGLAFIILGAIAAAAAVFQYRKVIRTLKAIEFPEGYHVNLGVLLNVAIAGLGIVLTIHLHVHGPGF
jgi:putative membrane protein